MCGIAGYYGGGDSSLILFKSIKRLFHRGYDSASIFVVDDFKFTEYRGINPRNENYNEEEVRNIKGFAGIAHNRYTTTGESKNASETQPFVFREKEEFLIFAHNGNIVNASALREELIKKGYRVKSNSDSEVLGGIFFDLYLSSKKKNSKERVFEAVSGLVEKCEGSYSVVAYKSGVGLIAFRDRFGIRPLVVTKRGDEVAITSENIATKDQGFDMLGDVLPGEAVIVNSRGIFRRICSKNVKYIPCAFEYVYLAREESTINGIFVKRARELLGEALGEYLLKTHSLDIDYVVPVPESARAGARSLARKIGVPYREGLKRKQGSLRSFILPNNRVEEVKRKFIIDDSVFFGKKIMLVDDSIVRGNTLKGLTSILKDRGIKSLNVAVYSPKIKYQNVYGIAIKTKRELMANNFESEEKMAEHLGVDSVSYLPLSDFKSALQLNRKDIKEFEMSCFTGDYLDNFVGEEYLKKLEKGSIV